MVFNPPRGLLRLVRQDGAIVGGALGTPKDSWVLLDVRAKAHSAGSCGSIDTKAPSGPTTKLEVGLEFKAGFRASLTQGGPKLTLNLNSTKKGFF